MNRISNPGFASLAVSLPDKYDSKTRTAAAQKVIQRDHNNQAIKSGGSFLFKFFRMGEWHDVSVDRVLPTSRRARPSKDKGSYRKNRNLKNLVTSKTKGAQ